MFKGISKSIFSTFLIWLFLVVGSAFLSIHFLPIFSNNFFGGGYKTYITAPLIWGWSNFDGEHYLSIAQNGYKGLQQAFFPVYPFVVRTIASIFSKSLISFNLSGVLISGISFLVSLLFIYKITLLDYSKKIAFGTVLVLLFFPTSFYFLSNYSESLFLLLTLLCYYQFRKGNYFLSGIIGAIASATRVFGILLLPMLLIEVFRNKIPFKKSFWVFLIPLGIIFYMVYLSKNYSDPFAFYNLQLIVGEQHQRGIVLLPQVFYRYINILTTSRLPLFALNSIILEFVIGIFFSLITIFGFIKKVNPSYLFYVLVGFIAPTVQGSFSSLPRYVVVLFPAFLIISVFINSVPRVYKFIYFFISIVWLIINTMLFFRGYWVS